jgi:hypothetical protein
VFLPVPESGDFRVDVGDAVQQELATQYSDFYNNKLSEAMNDIWGRLHETLTHMSSKLAGHEKQIFRDSLVDNAVELCGLLTKLNVTNDGKLERARQKLESALQGVDAEELRKHDDLRLDTKARVDEILSMF